MTYLLTFAQAMQAGPGIVGGKGWNLGRLAHFGFRVPPGCVISVQAYTDFLKVNELPAETAELATLSAEEAATEEVARRLDRLRQRIEQGALPPGLLDELHQGLAAAGIGPDDPLAIRSSATAEDSAQASFAGIHRSCLNVIGEELLAAAIRGCYASLWTATALTYRRKMGMSDDQVGAALVVQRLIQALYAGIAFTADPVTGRRDRVVVNASYGLGEAVVAGSVESDEYHLHIDHAGPVKLVGGRIGFKNHAVRPAIDGGTITEGVGYADRSEPVLAKPQLEELARVVRRIQDTLGDGYQPQDVEWCHDGWSLYVTQARPITALPEATFPALAGQPTIWSNANLKDATPGVQSPLGWWFNSLTVEVLLRQIFWRGGYRFPEGLNWSRLHNGRIYMNLSALQWAAYDAFGWLPAETNRALGGHQPEIQVPRPAFLLSARGRQRFVRLSRMGLILRRSARTASRSFQQVWDWCEAFEKRPLPARAHELELLHRLWEVEKQRREFLPETMIHNVGGLWSARLAQLLDRRFPGRGLTLTSALLAGSQEITSAEVGYRLIEIARLALAEEPARDLFLGGDLAQWRTALKGTRTLAALDRFFAEFGHRGVYEMEIMNPRWSEEPSFVLMTIRGHLREGLPAQDPREAAQAKRLAAEAEVGTALRFSPIRPLYRYLLKKARQAMRLREGAKSALVRLVRPARLTALAIGKRLEQKGILTAAEQVFFLTGDELAALLSQQWDGTGVQETLSHRIAQRSLWESAPSPDVLTGDRAVVNLRSETAPDGMQRRAAEGGGGQPPGKDGALHGVAVSSGQARGPACLIRHPSEGHRLKKGDILVAPSTDPAWTPLFLRASAVVMEVGGYLSHGAIVAREYGIPAVVNVAGAMSAFQEGELLEVDGDHGRVRPQLMSPRSPRA